MKTRRYYAEIRIDAWSKSAIDKLIVFDELISVSFFSYGRGTLNKDKRWRGSQSGESKNKKGIPNGQTVAPQ
ncbi:MAG: hypothetical protein LBV16_02145 [Elusimicrobiota bacterium]|jgi:hypothetical protein|nr:hypothetical protein [Elusimicrobiota bacterium]